MIKELLHPPEYPVELKTSKARIMYWVLWHLRLIDIGRGKVFGKFTQMLPEMGWIVAGLSFFKIIRPELIVVVWIGCIGFSLVWFGGWLYCYYRIDIIEQILSRYRDVMFKDLLDEVRGKNKNGKRK